jgi:serine/threonine-protein kinase RsbT
MNLQRKIYINNDLDVVTARMQAREMAKQLGFRTADQARISLAASELARVLSWNTNTPGEIIMSDADQNGQQGMQVTCRVELKYLTTDNGSKQLSEISQPGHSLAGACQLVDESIVEEQSNEQALVTLIKWLK